MPSGANTASRLPVLGVPITNQEAERAAVLQVPRQVPCLLGHPVPVRMGGRPGDMDPPGVDLDHEQHVQGAQPHRLHREEVNGEDAGGLVRRNWFQFGLEPPRRRSEAMAAEKHPDGRG